MIKKLTYYFLCPLFCFLSTTINAQETYKGAFSLTDSITGQAEYDFKERNETKFFDGPFKFQYASKLGDVFKSINYSGLFNDNRKNGPWLFSSKNLLKSDTLEISDYEISYKSSGFEHRVNSNFKNGNADGDWKAVEQNFENTQVTDTLFYATVSFKNAVMTNQIKATSEKMSWQGSFDDEGFADGQWIIKHKREDEVLEELRVYENGVFKTHNFTLNGVSVNLEHYGLDRSEEQDELNWEVLDNSNQYFNLFELSNSGSKNKSVANQVINVDEITKTTHQFFQKALSAFIYHNGDEIWNRITDEQRIDLVKFKVRKFPFSEEERKYISEISMHEKGITQVLNQFFKDPQVEIGKLSFKSLNRYYAIFEEYKKHSTEILKLAQILTNPSLEYLDRSVFMTTATPKITFNNQIEYSYNDESFSESYSFPELASKENFNLKEASLYFETIHENLKTELKNATVIFNDLRKIEALTELEESLVKKRNTIQDLFGNKNQEEDFNKFHQDINATVQEFVALEMARYAALSLDEKKQQIDGALSCFESVLNLYDFMADLPLKIARLEELYTRITFNPYIMVDMEEIVKERLYNGYSELVLPYLLEKIKSELACNTIPNNIDHIKNLINKMSQLREQDTAFKEKQLRRVKSAVEVITILELEIN